jgi:hypothetical protein
MRAKARTFLRPPLGCDDWDWASSVIGIFSIPVAAAARLIVLTRALLDINLLILIEFRLIFVSKIYI